MELPDRPFEYSIDCSCLEPLELLGLILPTLEEELGEVKGVFVEKVEEEKSHSPIDVELKRTSFFKLKT